MLGLGLSIPQLATRGGRTLTLSQQVAALFASGAQGAWYDPSDLTTLFEDAAGTIPITTPLEKPVGLMLDKSKGLVLGPELVTGDSSNFGGGTVGSWVSSGFFPATLSVVSGELEIAGASAVKRAILSVTGLTVGKTYLAQCVGRRNSASVSLLFALALDAGGSSNAAAQVITTSTVNVPLQFVFTAAGTSQFIVAGANTSGVAGDTYFIDNISVRELPGNHATQSTTTSRPTLSARYNLLTKTEQFDDGAWTKINTTVTPNTTATTDPLGGNTADKFIATAVSGTHCLEQSVTLAGIGTATIYVKAAEYSFFAISCSPNNFVHFDLTNGKVSTLGTGWSGASCVYISNGWYKCSVTSNSVTWSKLQIYVCNAWVASGNSAPTSFTGDGTSGIYIWGADLRVANDGVGLPPYQRVNTATDFAVDGFPAAEVFDGTDDNQITAAGGGSTTAFFWCSSIRVGKVGAVQTLFSDTGTNTGYRVRINASNQLELAAGNGSAYTTATTSDTLALGQRAVLTAWHDGANLNVQINNGTVVQAAFATATAGTAQITIGKDNNAASSYFMGRLYEKVYLKDTVVSASNITATKNYCAQKASFVMPVPVYSDEVLTAASEQITTADGQNVYMTVTYQ